MAAGASLSTMFVLPGRVPSPFGPIVVNTTTNDGSGSMQLSNLGVINTSLVLQFCPYPRDISGCISITSFATDANGKANINFTFPQKGNYTGSFVLIDAIQPVLAGTGTGSAGISFQSALLPAATITGGIQQATGNVPGKGTIVVNETTAHITLTGATPNHTFKTTLCPPSTGQCMVLANVTTDAEGNASVDVGQIQAAGWSMFFLSDSDGVEFVNGFQVQ